MGRQLCAKREIEFDKSRGRKGSIAGRFLRSRNVLVGVMVECSVVDGRCSMSASLSLLGVLAGGYKFKASPGPGGSSLFTRSIDMKQPTVFEII